MDLTSALGGLFNAGTGSSAPFGSMRVPLSFTTRLRQGSVVTQVVPGEARTINSAEAITFFGSSTYMSRVDLAVNPKSVKVTQAKRIVKKDVREGSVFFHFGNLKGQNLDVAVMEFQGNTGNIDLRDLNPDEEGGAEATMGALYKLRVWHNLYVMTREPMYLADGSANTVTLTYTSPLFPLYLDIRGHFNAALEYSEDAAKPHSRNYAFGFTVHSTEPPMDKYMGMLDDILSTPANAKRVNTAGGLASSALSTEVPTT